MISLWYYVGLLVCIALSAFFSSSEMSYSSANKLRLKASMDAGSKSAKLALDIIDKFDDALSTILIGNNLVNIAASSLASVIIILITGTDKYATFTTIGLTIIIIIFGETMPKIVAKKNATKFAISFAYIIKALEIILKPVIFIVVGLVHLITRFMKGDVIEDSQEAAAQELQSIIEAVEEEGVIDEERSELLISALEFDQISASEVMTSRVDMFAIDIEDDIEEIHAQLEDTIHSRIPVYESSPDNIIGVLYMNHYLKAAIDGKPNDLRPLLIEPCYVYKTFKLPQVLNELREKQVHIAIVTDEYGGSIGLITMEDVLEQIVGDIWDESDEVETEVVEFGKGVFELSGDLSIGEFLEVIDRSEESFETESATVGGWTLEMFGKFPKPDESFTFENMIVTVKEIDGLRVEKVEIQVIESEETEE